MRLGTIKMGTTEDVISQVADGVHDVNLKALLAAVRARHEYLNRQRGLRNQVAMTPGTRVRVSGNIRPKYLLGLTGTVSGKPSNREGDLHVQLDSHQRTGRYSHSLNVPATCLTEIED
jgi:hypothetical protein